MAAAATDTGEEAAALPAAEATPAAVVEEEGNAEAEAVAEGEAPMEEEVVGEGGQEAFAASVAPGKEEEEAAEKVEQQPEKKQDQEVKQEGQEEEGSGMTGRPQPLTEAEQAEMVRAKKRSSPWFIFLQENRERAKAEHPSLSLTELQKLLGEEYRKLSPEQKEALQKEASEAKDSHKRLKARAAAAAAAAEDGSDREDGAGGDGAMLIDGEGGTGGVGVGSAEVEVAIPFGRVKKIVKLDGNVKTISKDGVAAMAKATELFLQTLARAAAEQSVRNNRKNLRHTDVITAIHSNRGFDFLRLDFPTTAADGPAGGGGGRSRSRARSGSRGRAGEGSSSSSSSAASSSSSSSATADASGAQTGGGTMHQFLIPAAASDAAFPHNEAIPMGTELT